MTPKPKQEDPVIKLNASTVFTSVLSALMVAGIIWVISSISGLQKTQIQMNDAIQELQRSVNHLNTPKH